MKKALQVAMFSLFTVIGFNAQANEHHHETMSEAQPQVISATGEVKGIDLESKKITIHHDPIAAVNWPEMTMRFTITPQTKKSEIKTGVSIEKSCSFCERDRGRNSGELWRNVCRREKNEDCDNSGWLRRWISKKSFK